MVRIRVIHASRLLAAAAAIILVIALAVLVISSAGRAQTVSETAAQAVAAAFSFLRPPAMEFELRGENEHTDRVVGSGMEIEVARNVPERRSACPRVLIYHTHTHEAYQMTDQEAYTPLENWRTDDSGHNIVRVGDELTAELEKRGFEVVHDDTDFEQDDLSTSYSRSLEALLQRGDEDYDLIIDLHRDAYVEGAQLTCSYAGRKSANLMVLIGKGDSFQEKPHFQENYALACALTEKINGLCPGLGREVMVKTGRYNQHFSDHSLLIEVGSNGNTLEEALSSMPILADAIEEVLCGQSTPGVVTVSSDGAK